MLFSVMLSVSERPISAAAPGFPGVLTPKKHFELMTKAKLLCFSRNGAVHSHSLGALGTVDVTQFLSRHLTQGYKLNEMMVEQE